MEQFYDPHDPLEPNPQELRELGIDLQLRHVYDGLEDALPYIAQETKVDNLRDVIYPFLRLAYRQHEIDLRQKARDDRAAGRAERRRKMSG